MTTPPRPSPPTHLLYLHGFRSSPQSFKALRLARWLAAHRPEVHWWCPQLPPSPRQAMAQVHAGIADWPSGRSAVLGSTLGAWRPVERIAVGGMGAITKAMASSFQASGGEIRTGSGIDRFLVSNNRVTGVALENGDAFQADTVISGMDVRRTFIDHTDEADLPEAFVKGVKRYRFRGSSGKLNISL